MTHKLAKRFVSWMEGMGRLGLFAREVFLSLTAHRTGGRELVRQLHFIGVKSQAVVVVTGAFTGMVLTAQTYFQFHKIHMDSATLAVVGVSMCSELGPVLTGLMVAGRVGAALAAELGTMRVTEQIDALRTLATHPVDYLVAPRVLGSMIAMPLLTAESMAVGIGAGYLLAAGFLNIEPAYLWHNMVKYTNPGHALTGVIKSVLYGVCIGVICCYKGMHCPQGAEGVGRATTEAVVYSCITILVSNFFLTLGLERFLG
jgi:phospholipid/cholesterol/gamma-HCH transport system permease protein